MNELMQAVAFGFYLLDRHEYQDAAMVAAQILAERPQELAAHRLYIAARIEEKSLPRTSIEARYRAWLAQSPGSELRRTALAFGLGYNQGGAGDWCGEVDRLTSPLPQDPEVAYWALRVRRDAHLDGCEGGEPQGDLEAITALSLEVAQPFVAVVRLAQEPVSLELASELRLAWERQPWRLSSARPLWEKGVGGEALEQARKDAIEASRAQIYSFYAENIYGAWVVAGLAEEADLQRLLFSRLVETDPSWGRYAPALALIESTTHISEPVLALSELFEIKSQVHGKARAQWWLAAADRLVAMGKIEQSWEALDRAHRYDSEASSDRWVAGVADAAEGGYVRPSQIRAALRELEKKLDAPIAGSAEPGAVAVWTHNTLEDRAECYLLMARLYEALGQPEETEQAYRMALLLSPRWDGYLALGTLLAHQGRNPEALEALLTGLSMAPSSPTMAERARLEAAMRLALPLWEQGRWWDPEGIQGFVSASRLLVAAPVPPSEARPKAEIFPDLDLYWGEKKTRLFQIPGPLVVDLWASWCGPCIQSLPHLSQTAAAHPQIPFLAVSVDKKIEEAQHFVEKAGTPAYQPFWSGPAAMGKIGINSIPATYLLDAEHRIVARFTGWMPEDRRLEEAIAQLLSSP